MGNVISINKLKIEKEYREYNMQMASSYNMSMDSLHTYTERQEKKKAEKLKKEYTLAFMKLLSENTQK